ncbi:unnamed protein product [Caenorhabditis auriculariae]|uniref:Uncharacterized protein n=1 Tax=Caenorhabditis auriculariae TaxID=2777116 RepID=A0A8S1H1A9_9PELO|nr:unnamed protein product [Caenorhabditis auriculariae]
MDTSYLANITLQEDNNSTDWNRTHVPYYENYQGQGNARANFPAGTCLKCRHWASVPSIAQLVERRTVEQWVSLGRWFESGSTEFFLPIFASYGF